MRFLTLMLVFPLMLALGQSGSQTPHESGTAKSLQEQLPGAWKLISIETVRPNGEVIYPFYGKHPEGMLIYDRSGWMSVQIISDPKPTMPAASTREGFLAAAPAEKAAAADGFCGYYGTWTVDPSVPSVTHHINQSFYPAERGEAGTRHVTLNGNRLELTAKAHEMGEDHQRRLVWERILPTQ